MRPASQPRIIFDLLETAVAKNPAGATFLRREPGGQVRFQTYAEMKLATEQLIAGWDALGVQTGERMLFLCDPSEHWFVVDTSILSVGAVSVPRATDVTDDEILYIANHAECSWAIAQNPSTAALLAGLRQRIPALHSVILLEDESGDLARGPDTIRGVLELGRTVLSNHPDAVRRVLSGINEKALATLIYTSGTTGAPKGVMLTQAGWISAILHTLPRTGFRTGDRALSLLPPWHAFERAIEYAVVYLGLSFMITDIQNFRDDLLYHRPTVLPTVPRIWESVLNGVMARLRKGPALSRGAFSLCLKISGLWRHVVSVAFGHDLQLIHHLRIRTLFRRGLAWILLLPLAPLRLVAFLFFRPIRRALGGHMRVSISGGSALPTSVDRFLSAIGLTVLEGYGLTESAAILSIRDRTRPVPGTVGTPLEGVRIRFKNEQGQELEQRPFVKGVLWVKTDHLLTGYYRRPELNDVIFDQEGFFNTGDIMVLTARGELMYAGRSKDTIALAGGENIEPLPIEDRLLESPFIDQVMVVGDDRKTIGLLIVPDFERTSREIPDLPDQRAAWNDHPALRALLQKEIGRLISRSQGFKSFEHVPADSFYVVPRPFDLNMEMTKTLKMRRSIIKEHFSREIDEIYSRSRDLTNSRERGFAREQSLP